MKVAILIPTKNRLEFVERTVAYYDSLGSPHPIFFGDASDKGTAKDIARTIESFKNVDVRYFHWENLDAPRTFIKLAEIASKEFQFCVYTGDDDFFVPSSLTRCAEFLAENKDYRTAQGRAAMFDLDRSGAYGNIHGVGYWWGVNALEQETGFERLQYFRRNYYGTQFSMHRVDELLDDSKYFMTLENGILGELLHCFTFAIMGKSKFIDCLYLIRNAHDQREGSNLLEWIMQPAWSSDIETYLNGLSLSLCEVDALPLGRAREVAAEVLNDHFSLYGPWLNRPDKKVFFTSLLKRLLPIRLGNALRKLKALVMDENDMMLLRSKRSRFYEEFQPIHKSLTKRSM
jgi:glycosyltransferase domain-containing protein